MADEKARIGFSLDFKDTQQQLDKIIKGLMNLRKTVTDTGKKGSESINKLDEVARKSAQSIGNLAKSVRKTIEEGSKVSRKSLQEALTKSKQLEKELVKSQKKTASEYQKAEGKKRQALKKTLQEQKKAQKEVERLNKITQSGLRQQKKIYDLIAGVISLRLGRAMRSLIKDSALLAARNEVLGTAMRVVGNNMGITNSELERSENTIRKLGISIKDTRTLISRFAQAQLGMANATKLARAAQDLAAGSTLGSSEALQIMTQSIMSLLPRQLRQFGVVVNLNEVYKEQSLVLGKSVTSLTALEKRQGLLNKIFAEAEKRSGAYERSMEDVGKVLTTLASRTIPDTLSVLGEKFLPILEALVFGAKSLLEWFQKLPGGVKTFAAALVAAVAVMATLKGVVLAATAAFSFLSHGTAVIAGNMAAVSVAINPLILALGALAAAAIILPQIFGDTTTEQERLLESSQGMLNVQADRLDSLESLKASLEDQLLSEKELANIIAKNIGTVKDLVPLLNKEGVTREEVTVIIDGQIEKQKELLNVTLKGTKEANDANVERLKNERRILGELLKLRKELADQYGEENIPIFEFVKRLQVFETQVEKSGVEVNRMGEFMRQLGKGRIKELNAEFVRLGKTIQAAMDDAKNSFGLSSSGINKSSDQMEASFKSLNLELDKLIEKTTKKFPFKKLIEEQEDFSKRVEEQVASRSITEERASELRLRSQEVFQTRFEQAELKFQEKLDSLGQGRLAKIEARKQKELEINQGSDKAIQAIQLEATLARNAVFASMWTNRLAITQEGVDGIINVIKQQRNLTIGEAKRQADLLKNVENISSDERIQITNDFYATSLAIIEASQAEELAVRESFTQAANEQVKALFAAGLVDEQQFAERSQAIAKDLSKFQQQQVQERIDFLKTALNSLVNEEKSAQDRIKALKKGELDAEKSTEDALRKLRQEGQTDLENRQEENRRAQELLAEGEIALQEGNFLKVKQISDEVKQIALSNSKAIRESGEKDARVLISSDDARRESMNQVREAGALLQRSFETQRADEVTALEKVRVKIDDIKTQLDDLTAKKREIDVEVKGNALAEIDKIKTELASIRDKTVTVTVVTKHVSAGRPGIGTPSGDGEGGEGLAAGAVDIEGPGTTFSDSILAFLSRGESVITAAATRTFKPLLEMMNADPERLKSLLIPSIQGSGALVGSSSIVNNQKTINRTDVGAISITIEGKGAEDVRGINWRQVVREQIAPEINRLTKRKTSI